MVSGIGSIGALSSSSSSSSTQSLTAQTKAKLESMGIDTSNIKTETQGQQVLQSVQQTQNSQNADQANKVSTQIGANQPGPPPAWVSLMKQNGITPTGKIDGDKTAVTAALKNMDPSQAKSIASQFQAAGLAVTAPNDTQQANSQKVDAFAGLTQLSNMNKHFMVN